MVPVVDVESALQARLLFEFLSLRLFAQRLQSRFLQPLTRTPLLVPPRALIRAIAWHKLKSRLAVALRDDAIYIYDLVTESKDFI